MAYRGHITDSYTILRMMEERIKQARKEKRWNQAELARRMCLTQPSVADWESGRKAPHMKNLVRLAKILEVNLEWLSTGHGEMRPSRDALARQPQPAEDWMLPQERQLLVSFSRLKPAQREALLGFLDTL